MGSVTIRLDCPAEGASIGYTTQFGPDPQWQIYAGEITPRLPVRLRAKAIRYGYRESDETSAQFP